MKKCLLLLTAVFLLSAARAQQDSIVSASPNSLLNFQVQAVEKVVSLTWRIEEGWTYKNFDIERSDDGVNFHKVGSRLGISKNSQGEYEFVDATPRRNTPVKYRLKLFSTDGLTVLSTVKETKVTDEPWSLRIKQNPVRNNIQLEIEMAAAKSATVVVLSNAGQAMLTQTVRLYKGKNGHALSLQGILPGLYQLIVDIGNERKTTSFIKE